MKKAYLFTAFLLLLSLSSHAQFTEMPGGLFPGLFYGDCSTGDFDGDGKTDLILSGAKPGYNGMISIHLNANGFEASNLDNLSPIMYSAIGVADINGDGRTDFAITGTRTDVSTVVFEIYYGQTDGTFTKNEATGIAAANFGSMQMADFNADGKTDILVNGTTGSTYFATIYIQGEDGTFTPADIALMGTYFSDTKVFDANGDGLADILITGFSTSFAPETKLYLNQGGLVFTETSSNLGNVYFSSIDVADINNDGHPDVVLSGMDSTFTASLSLYLNDGTGNFALSPHAFTGTYSGSTLFIDYNQDGQTDIFSVGVDAGNTNIVLLYKNNGDGTFTHDTENSAQLLAVNMSRAVWLDADNNAAPDLFIMGYVGTDTAKSSLFINQHTATPPCNQMPGPEVGDTGCITFDHNGIVTTYTTVRGKDGKVWLQHNLGSPSVATSATDDTSFGDLYQWGRWTDGHQKRSSELSNTLLSPNNPTGLADGQPEFIGSTPEWWASGTASDQWQAKTPQETTAQNGCDPCKALGNDWSVPTQSDWQDIIAAEQITDVATAFESSLKLTVGGSRLQSGNFNFTGVRGYYWSKTTSDNADYAKYLYYSNFIVNPNAGSTRGQGLSVRCIFNGLSYCDVGVDWDIEPITLVNFADLNNPSSAIVNDTPALEDFTSLTANVNLGETYTLVVKGNTVGPFEHDIRAFFDWNQDGVFDMATEYYHASLLPSTGEDDVKVQIDIEIPSDAVLGKTRMRIIKDMWNVYEEGEFDACLNAYYGQVEDYSIDIQDALSVEKFTGAAVSVHPNPTSGLVHIHSNGRVKTVTVFNALGQMVGQQKSGTIDLTAQQSGIYWISIEMEDGTKQHKKIIRK